LNECRAGWLKASDTTKILEVVTSVTSQIDSDLVNLIIAAKRVEIIEKNATSV
jgi:hypothetical protein